ncbi:MAG: hypothetical protein ABI183_10895, partial [Polyangiaceae bacterium]
MAKKLRSSKAKASALLLLAIAVAACGGAERPASSPAEAAPANDAQPSGASAGDNKGGAMPAAPPEASPSTQSASPSANGGGADSDGVQAELRSTRHDLDTARRDLEASQGDCVNVCRALSSLERVTVHFCALA